MPKAVWIALAVCAVILFAIPMASQQAWRWKAMFGKAEVQTDTARALNISGSAIDPACMCIRGKITNSSNRVFNEVQIYFQLRAEDRSELGTVVALTATMLPHATVTFASDSLPKKATKFDIKEIKAIH